LNADESDALRIDLAYVREALALVTSDPLQSLRHFVPREVLDEAAYSTAVIALECTRPAGRLLVFGGPHRFFNRIWDGDSCVVFIDRRGRPLVFELPYRPLGITHDGREVHLRHGEVSVDLRFEHVHSRRDRHGLGRFFGQERIAEWLPGLEVARGLFRFAGGHALLGNRPITASTGWMLLESGCGRLLHWPFGSTWHYASWLTPDGACGSMVHAAPMLGASTPRWWRQLIERATNGSCALSADGHASAESAHYEIALDAGPPIRLVRDCAAADGLELRYRVLSAAVVPFDEEGQLIFRLRCLAGGGAGLLEIPASLPGLDQTPRACALRLDEGRASIAAGGREILAFDTQGSDFITTYEPPKGALRRLATWLAGRR
jgi:hypothetical protein